MPDANAAHCLRLTVENHRHVVANTCGYAVHASHCVVRQGHCVWTAWERLDGSGSGSATMSTGRPSGHEYEMRVAGCRADRPGYHGWAAPVDADGEYRCLVAPLSVGESRPAVAVQMAPTRTHCLEYTSVDGGEPRLWNTCLIEIVAAYCSRSRSPADGGCGYDDRYFTDFVRLGPRGSASGSTSVAGADARDPELSMAACETFAPDGWDGNGAFRCLPP